MPPKFCHIRESVRKVGPEFYKVIDKLKSQFHCSPNQAVAAVIEVANGMFGHSWKYHDQDDVIDIDTAPHIKNIQQSGKAIGALTLACIVDEMMKSHNAVITYQNDGSKK